MTPDNTKMNYYLTRLEPKNETGEHFRNNVWWWVKLWWFTSQICKDVLNEKDIIEGYMKEGYTIRKGKSAAMAERLENVLKNKEEYEDLAKQSPHSEDNIETGIEQELRKRKYPFNWENFEKFYEFVKYSGGFQIK